jgi:thymidylate kinase
MSHQPERAPHLKVMEKLAPLIAVVGCDGSGKSTLAQDILAYLKKSRPSDTVYLGLGSGAMGNQIKTWPVIGPAFERYLSKRASQARDPNGIIPGLPAAVVLYRLSLKRKAQFERLLDLRRKGVTVVTDRYPQIDVPGFYDGPGLSAARAEGWLIKKLAAKERAIYEWMASYVPTLVIRLNVDADTALQRKPDHNRALIERKVAVTPSLTFNGAPIVDLDATMDYKDEYRLATNAVDAILTSRA